MQEIINFLVQSVSSLGYIGIFLLMCLESSFFPFPSEVVMIPAGFLIYQGKMNFILVIIAGVLGSFIWSLILVILGYFIGNNQELIHKYLNEIAIFITIFGIIVIIFYIKRKNGK